jgi:hypothetical protein
MIPQLLTPKKKPEQNKTKQKQKQNKTNQKTKTNKESKTTESTCENPKTPYCIYIYIFFIGKYQYIKSARGATHVHRTYTKRAHLYKLLIRKRRTKL